MSYRSNAHEPLLISPRSFIHYTVTYPGTFFRPGIIEADPGHIKRLRRDQPRPSIRVVKAFLGNNARSLIQPYVTGRKDVGFYDLSDKPFSYFSDEGTLASVRVDELEDMSELLGVPNGVLRFLRCEESALRERFKKECLLAGSRIIDGDNKPLSDYLERLAQETMKVE